MLRRHVATAVSLARGSLLTEDADPNDIDECLLDALRDLERDAISNITERRVRADVGLKER